MVTQEVDIDYVWGLDLPHTRLPRERQAHMSLFTSFINEQTDPHAESKDSSTSFVWWKYRVVLWPG